MMHSFPGDAMFTIVPVFIGIVFVIVIGSIIIQAGKGVAEWSHNNSLPVVNKQVRVIAKRANTVTRRRRNHHHHHGSVHHHHSTSTTSHTTYTITFEAIDNRERLAFTVSEKVFDCVFEEDTGTLTHQGTRFHNFQLA